MKKTLFLFLVIFSSSLFATSYSNFIDAQLQNYYKMNEHNISEEEIQQVLQDENRLYNNVLTTLLVDRNKYIKEFAKYEQKIFSLQKIITINKRAGNSTAVLRDEVRLKSYQILRSQGKMLKDILYALNKPDLESFENQLTTLVNQNQAEILKIDDTNYKEYLSWTADSNVVVDLQANVKEYYALLELNRDIIVYLYRLKEKMYGLNKYEKYHLIEVVYTLDSLEFFQPVNELLEKYGLDVTKLFMMIVLSIFVYTLRKVALFALRNIMLHIEYLKEYSERIVVKLIKPIDSLFIVININLLIYLYNNFSSIDYLTRGFNIIYSFYATYILYIIVNRVATIKLRSIDTTSKNIKKDIINVSIKIINFVILIIGILLALYFAGVDLTTVLSGLGIGGFALAFAAKDTISNFFGTVSILFSDVFSQGDWIAVDNKEGVVVEIGLRVTTLRTFDNALIAIPNGTFASKDVKNWNKRKVGRRIKMNIGVKYSSKSDDIKRAVAQIKEMLLAHPDIATPNTKYEYKKEDMTKLVSKDDLEGVKTNLLVYLDQFSASSIDILIYCFSKSVMWEDWLKTKEDVMHKIMKILEENSLEFAFPSLSVYQEK
ncbi:mechanosensitive ion channel family protein [Sulfurimonas marina]|uniref:Mechanosensitive ion channel family protein n=1 Tax=Sulfurimonas marina TaxID=2590551 RepID=A0A7M1ATV4_9BACT|nr:mechanosensitive ion channel family protein [Sulfurimonas marina]QOP40855.1 mechanosensitive ion channel family protein [Sulfurimonas marina]